MVTAGQILHQIPAVVTAAHQFPGGSQIQNHFRAIYRKSGRARLRNHSILVNFDTHNRIVTQTEQLLGADGNVPIILAGNQTDIVGHHIAFAENAAGHEPTFFFRCQVSFGHDAHHFAPGKNRGAVIQAAAHPQGEAHHGSQLGMFTGAEGNLAQALFDTVPQNILPEQVAAGIAGQGKFRKQQNIHIVMVRHFHPFANFSSIRFHIAHLHRRHGTGNSDKVQHRYSSHDLFFLSYHHLRPIAKRI